MGGELSGLHVKGVARRSNLGRMGGVRARRRPGRCMLGPYVAVLVPARHDGQPGDRAELGAEVVRIVLDRKHG